MDSFHPVPCRQCGAIVQLWRGDGLQAKSTICEKCDPLSTSPSTPPAKTRRNALLILGGIVAVQVVYFSAIDPFVKQANHFNDCVEIQKDWEEEDGGSFDAYEKVQAVNKCNGGR